ncbi:MAG: DpnD/PcfM family protein [Prevotella sp.]|nr:DpnD/PcfM family protein [Candidatus Equicola faecalis]
MKYTVLIEETLVRLVTVEAESRLTALKEVHRQYRNEEIILSADDYCTTHFEVE